MTWRCRLFGHKTRGRSRGRFIDLRSLTQGIYCWRCKEYVGVVSLTETEAEYWQGQIEPKR